MTEFIHMLIGVIQIGLSIVIIQFFRYALIVMLKSLNEMKGSIDLLRLEVMEERQKKNKILKDMIRDFPKKYKESNL